MHYVYILKSRLNGEFYTGCTNNLQKRIREHNSGKVKWTSDSGPYDLIFYEAFTNKYDAFLREKWLKTGWGRNHISKMLSNTLKKV